MTIPRWASIALAACTSSVGEPAPAPAPPPAEPGGSSGSPADPAPAPAALGETVRKAVETDEDGDLELGPLVGGTRPRLPARPGRYAMSLHARQHRFITMERTTSRTIDGGAVLDLRDDHTTAGCVWAKTLDESSTSKYAAHDGKHHETRRDHDTIVGLRGGWVLDAAARAVVVTLDGFEHGRCEVSRDAPATDPVPLRCHALDAGKGLPAAAVACRLDGSRPELETVALLLADTPSSGSWDLRSDLAHRSTLELPDGTKPWLLLGTGGGLRIDHADSRERDPLRVGIEAATVRPPP